MQVRRIHHIPSTSVLGDFEHTTVDAGKAVEYSLRQLEQERRTFDNRNRFQQEHLQKLRSELEVRQREDRIERQQTLTRIEQRDVLFDLRAAQLEHYRELLVNREESVERERRLLAASRHCFVGESGQERQRFRGERETWDQERQAQRAEIRRQQDMLTLHAENLEGRKSRLDQLRVELEETHRETLEMRMAVEEAWAQLTQASGSDAAQERVDQARSALSDHFAQLRESLAQQCQGLLNEQSQHQQQQNEFREERQKLTEWISVRDKSLQQREEQLSGEADDLQKRHASFAAENEARIAEKADTERVIRDLLKQISELTAVTLEDAAIRN